jgi:hypothetical protein
MAALPLTEVEQVLETWPKKVNHHHVVVALHTIPPHVGDANCTGRRQKGVKGCQPTQAKILQNALLLLTSALQDLVELGLIQELGVPGLDRLLRCKGAPSMKVLPLGLVQMNLPNGSGPAPHQLDGDLLAILDVGACRAKGKAPGQQTEGMQNTVAHWPRKPAPAPSFCTAGF